jgi:hypothetical protein
MAQSKPYWRFPRASDSGLDFTGFSRWAASSGIETSEFGVAGLDAFGASWAETRNAISNRAKEMVIVLHIRSLLVRSRRRAVMVRTWAGPFAIRKLAGASGVEPVWEAL